MQVCNENYYYTAVNSVLNSVENPVFFVFSTGHDDIRWIKENYHFNAKVEYVDLDNPDYEELRLMMNCKRFWRKIIKKKYGFLIRGEREVQRQM